MSTINSIVTYRKCFKCRPWNKITHLIQRHLKFSRSSLVQRNIFCIMCVYCTLIKYRASYNKIGQSQKQKTKQSRQIYIQKHKYQKSKSAKPSI